MSYLASANLLGRAENPRQQPVQELARIVEPEVRAEYRHQHGNDNALAHQAHAPLVLGLLLPAKGLGCFQPLRTLLTMGCPAPNRFTAPLAGVE